MTSIEKLIITNQTTIMIALMEKAEESNVFGLLKDAVDATQTIMGVKEVDNTACKWLSDEFTAVCTNADCPCCADFCECLQYPEICRYSEVKE